MKWLRQIFDFYIDASIHVSLAVLSFYWITLSFLNIPPNFLLAGFIFFSSIAGYNFIKYGIEFEKHLEEKPSLTVQYRNILSLLSAAIALFFMYQMPQDMWITIGVLGLLSILYAVPFFPNFKNLRSLGGLKIYLVAIVWVGYTVYLPVQMIDLNFSNDVWITFVQRFLLVLVLMVPFEIRDMNTDSPALRTLPQQLGVRQTRWLTYVLLLIFFLLTFVKARFTEWEVLLRAVVVLTIFIVMKLTKKKQGPYFAAFWVEAIPIVWWMLVWLSIHYF